MPDAFDAQQDVSAYQEQLVKARALPEGHLAELCEVTKAEAERTTGRLREDQQRWWDLWANDVVFDGKEEWQSQVWPAKPFAAVEQGGALIQRSLLDSPEFFGVSGQEAEDKLLAAHVVKPLKRRALLRALANLALRRSVGRQDRGVARRQAFRERPFHVSALRRRFGGHRRIGTRRMVRANEAWSSGRQRR